MKKDNMKNIQLVILMAGNATRLTPLTYALPKGLLSIDNKPGIYNMLYDFVSQGLRDITIIVSPSNNKIVQSFLEKAFTNIKLNFVVQENPKGPLHAFQLSSPHITKPTLLLLGDTSCETDLKFETNWLGYMDIDDDSHSRWCLIETDKENKVLRQIDKPKEKPNTDKALVGIYFFNNPTLLKESLNQKYELKNNELQLSSAIDYYKQFEDFTALKINDWNDSGALNTYTATIKKIKSQNYNFYVDEFLSITKEAKNKYSEQNIKNEIHFLEEVQKLDCLTAFPRLLKKDKKQYSMEYLDYTSIFEFFNFYPITQMNQVYMFEKVLNTLNYTHKSAQPKNIEQLQIKTEDFYQNAIKKGLETIKGIPYLESIKVNGVKLAEIKQFSTQKLEGFKTSSDTSKYGLIHNNLFFSNILYLQKISGVKFLSPKGFNNDLYGDTRLDYAMLKLNYAVRIEDILNNLFLLEKNDNENYTLTWLCKNLPVEEFDNLLSKYTSLEDVNLIMLILILDNLKKLTIKQQIVILFLVMQIF